MDTNKVLMDSNISHATLRNWKRLKYIEDTDNISKKSIDSILKNKVNSRRNKRSSTKNFIPSSYVNDKEIIKTITSILELKEKYNVSLKEILYEAIVKILKNNDLRIPICAIKKVLGNRSYNKRFINEFNDIKISYRSDNDFLGCLYMSLISIGKKDINGIFYTPFKIVNKIVTETEFKSNSKILDPGCGSGNFLIQAFKKMKKSGMPTGRIIHNLYGFDIDEIAVLLAKINIYILDKNINFGKINIYVKDFLMDETDTSFDIIIGNPPWGKKYTNKEKKQLCSKYDISFSKMDSFSQFIIVSLNILNSHGSLEFVLPSSILNIATHKYIRETLLNYQIKSISTIGREFEEIVTDVVIIKVIKKKSNDNICNYNSIKISQNFFKSNPYFNFLIHDSIAESIINKIKEFPHFNLVDDVQYALGIVTGNNKGILSSSYVDGYEPIMTGKDISRYTINYSNISKYINYDRKKLQQVAKDELYRSKYKIVYKFIGKKLCFALDNKGILSLNSANLICFSNDKDIYYICAILNSRITQLYFEEIYNTHKVLKNHIQAFNIPDFDTKTKNKISSIIKNLNPQTNYCEEVEKIIYNNLNLTDEEIEYLKNRF